MNPCTSLADAQRLIATIQDLGVTAPKSLCDVLQAHETLTRAPARVSRRRRRRAARRTRRTGSKSAPNSSR
jgi:hypothetical protein